jgi:hypothetical protein
MQVVKNYSLVSMVGVLALAGCVTAPSGPNVMALPGSGKSFDQFQNDDQSCRAFAQQQVGPYAGDAAANRANNTAIGATLIGTAAGALLGAAGGRAGEGAAVGAGVGLLAGSSIANDGAHHDAGQIQRAYNASYTQCMYGKGNQVPVPGGSYSSGGNNGGPPPDYAPSRPGYGAPPDYAPSRQPGYGAPPDYVPPRPGYGPPPGYAPN